MSMGQEEAILATVGLIIVVLVIILVSVLL